MNDELLATIKRLVNGGRYRIKIHAVRHMIEEGFSERDIIVAILGENRIFETYIAVSYTHLTLPTIYSV